MSMEIDGKSNVVSATPVINTVQYTTGDLLGGLLTFTDALQKAQSGVIFSAVITDLAKADVTIDIVLFDSNPTGTTFTNNAALDIADADLPKVVGVIKMDTYADFNDNSVAYKNAIGLVLRQTAGKDLYACLVVRGAPTYAVGDIVLKLGILQD